MPETLEQSEIDALLSTVEAQDAVEGAFQIFSRHRKDSEPIEIRSYDFKRPERISKDQVRAIHALHETFARDFSASLSSFLRMITECAVAQVEQMTYAEFIGSLPNPTCFNLLESAGLQGAVGLELSPLIIYPIIERLLGGTSKELLIPQRPLTAIEARLVKQILSRIVTCLSETWQSFSKGGGGFTLGEMETNPQLVQFIAPNEIVVIVRFEITIAKRAGSMCLCIPFKLIEGTLGELAARKLQGGNTQRSEVKDQKSAGGSPSPADGRKPRADSHSPIAHHLGGAKLDLSVILAETTMTVRDLQMLEKGDVIVTAHPARGGGGPVTVCVESKPKFSAQIGQHRGKRAIQIASQA